MENLSSLKPIYGNEKSPQKIKAALLAAGLSVEDVSGEYGYFNLRVPVSDGYLRVYKAHDGTIREQRWRKVTMEYSGIPTFEPSGRKSF